MSIINKLRGTETPELPVHQFGWALQLWLLGEMTRAEALGFLQAHVPAFAPTAAEITQMDNVKTKFDAMTNAQKNEFLHKFEPASEALRFNVITVARYKLIMGITED